MTSSTGASIITRIILTMTAPSRFRRPWHCPPRRRGPPRAASHPCKGPSVRGRQAENAGAPQRLIEKHETVPKITTVETATALLCGAAFTTGSGAQHGRRKWRCPSRSAAPGRGLFSAHGPANTPSGSVPATTRCVDADGRRADGRHALESQAESVEHDARAAVVFEQNRMPGTQFRADGCAG